MSCGTITPSISGERETARIGPPRLPERSPPFSLIGTFLLTGMID